MHVLTPLHLHQPSAHPRVANPGAGTSLALFEVQGAAALSPGDLVFLDMPGFVPASGRL